MTINIDNQLLIVSLFFFGITWFMTYLFIRANVFFKVVVFAFSISIFISLERFDTVAYTVAAFVGASVAYFNGLVSAFIRVKNFFLDIYYYSKDFFSAVFYFFELIFSTLKKTLIFIISFLQLIKKSETKKSPSSSNNDSGSNRNNQNKSPGYEKQRQQAKEEFRKAREEAKIKEESQKTTQSQQDNRSFENIVGVNPQYTKSELKTAYRKSASQYHPDKYAHMSEEFRKEAEAEFKKIQKAYNTLSGRLG